MDHYVEDYIHYLAVERGLSTNTLAAYERDLGDWLDYLEDQGIASLLDVDYRLLITYMHFKRMFLQFFNNSRPYMQQIFF